MKNNAMLPLPEASRLPQPRERISLFECAAGHRPFDRRQRRLPVPFDMRANSGERRRRQRRAVYDPGRRRWPEPPLGIDVWA
ncbi:MAG: hypothetical protein GX093_00570 [Xanthomonadaceae bacterium]|nr:hypothetical protein [Xanthomonadaceae bacterium]